MQEKLKKLVIALAVLALLAFVANILVDNPYTHRFVRALINAKVEESTNLTVDFKAMKVSVVPPGAELYGLAVATKVTPDAPLLSASHARARVSVWSLVLGKTRLALLEADDLTLIWPPPFGFGGFLKAAPAGPPEPDGPLAWPPAFDLPVDNVILKNAKVYAEVPLTEAVPMAPGHFVTSVVGLDLDFDYGGWNDLRAKVSVHSANAALRASSLLEETSLDSVLVVAGDQIALPTLRLRGERLNFDGALTGGLKLGAAAARSRRILDALEVSVSGDVDGDLSLLGSYIDLPGTRGGVKGNVQITATAPVASAAPASVLVEGQGKVKDGYLNGFRLYDSKATFHITPELVSFPAIDIMIGEQTVGKGQGAIKVGDVIGFDFHAQPDGLKLSDLLDALSVDFDLIETEISSPDLRIFGQSEPFQVNVAATGQFLALDTPTIVMDRARFPAKPACRLDFHLMVLNTNVDFGGTHGTCFLPPPGKVPLPPPGVISAPHGADVQGKILASGGIFFDERGVKLDIRGEEVGLPLAQYFAQQPLAGTATSRSVIHGNPPKILVDNEVSVLGLVFRGIPLGNLHGFATTDGRDLWWHDVVSDLEGMGQLSSKAGKLGINDDYPLRAQITARQVAPGYAKRIIAGASGSASPFYAGVDKIEADFSGPMFYPGAWQGRFDLALYDGIYDGEHLFDAARAGLKSDAHGWTGEPLSLSLGALTVVGKLRHGRAFPFSLAEARGTRNAWAAFGLHPDDKYAIEFKTLAASGGGAKDMLQTLPVVGKKLKPAGVEGEVQLTGQLKGTPGDMQGTFEGGVLHPTLLGSPMNQVDLKGFVKNGQLDIVLSHSGGAFEGRMSIDVLKASLPYEWYFNFNRMDLRAFGTEFFHKDPRNYLYLTAGWHMRGQLTDWWRSVGELEFKDIRAKYVQDLAGQTRTLAIRQEQPVTLRFSGSAWQFDGDKDLYLSGRNIQVRASMQDNQPPERLGIHLESIIDMALAKEFSPEVETASGKVRLVADVKGSVSEPKLRIELTDLKPNPFIAATWAPVTLGLSDLKPEFKNVRLKVIYEDQRLVIDSFAAAKGTGAVSVSGALDFNKAAAPEDSRLDFALDDATVIFPVALLKSFEAQLSGNLALTGSQFPFKVAGDVKVNRTRSTKDVDIRTEIINALRSSGFKTSVKSEKPSFLFDLSVNADQTINIHNRNLQCLASMALQVKGTDVAPSVSGQVEINKGKFIYKRDFKINRGLVTFDDPVKFDPSLDILAVSEVEAYRVYIAVTGRASNPTVEFSVDPPNREDGTPISKIGILVLLSRGKLPDESSNFEQTTRGTATSEALNLLLGQYEEPVERLFDLSGQNIVRNVYIDVHPSTDNDEQGAPVPRLNLPLDLGEDFDVVLRSDTSANEISAEYDIHDNIRMSGTLERKRDDPQKATTQPLNPAGDTRLNLKFRFSFD